MADPAQLGCWLEAGLRHHQHAAIVPYLPVGYKRIGYLPRMERLFKLAGMWKSHVARSSLGHEGL